jgi:hypothetical protein
MTRINHTRSHYSGSTTHAIDGCLLSVATHALECTSSWVPEARLIGDCRADDLKAIFQEYLVLKQQCPNLNPNQKETN